MVPEGALARGSGGPSSLPPRERSGHPITRPSRRRPRPMAGTRSPRRLPRRVPTTMVVVPRDEQPVIRRSAGAEGPREAGSRDVPRDGRAREVPERGDDDRRGEGDGATSPRRTRARSLSRALVVTDEAGGEGPRTARRC